ncbi:MAG: 50S ribosomal protein L18 [Candidatus Blackburnbacteria bacterium RIFCSPLOWO2_01_FULL_41_27]|uniref:Large ribosomal subunit protein uL18 n=2 Tax=Candidatus Blackburniibacteriota TaxID=1817898 RepID=A0A1G1VA40_9BACT|nr:MAG: 50S ribosomal protein L18 [Candidatus Blackburnbacteria bacterium RIFCSPHIGHO2_12_FULL_41_13b]OGY14839.1 MAG: 50S ribosomal protein L18 [Candidatus Blackburnbacteria bacterium RIFCSPLOWO2_01_FULL_41_27]
MKQKTRKQRVRKKLRVTSSRPRLTVFVSNKHIYAQIIDDAEGRTLAAARDADVKDKNKIVATAQKVGEELAVRAVKLGVKQVVFDRGGRKYHGRIKALADSARAGGLEF